MCAGPIHPPHTYIRVTTFDDSADPRLSDGTFTAKPQSDRDPTLVAPPSCSSCGEPNSTQTLTDGLCVYCTPAPGICAECGTLLATSAGLTGTIHRYCTFCTGDDDD